MKKLLLVLLLTTNVFAMSEGRTDANMDSICFHRGTLENMDLIDGMLQEETKQADADTSSSVNR